MRNFKFDGKTRYLFLCENCDQEWFVSARPSCPDCQEFCAPMFKDGKPLPASSPRGREIAHMMGFEDSELRGYVN